MTSCFDLMISRLFPSFSFSGTEYLSAVNSSSRPLRNTRSPFRISSASPLHPNRAVTSCASGEMMTAVA